MHDELFEQPAVVARYRAGPYAESREQFLRQARADGYSPATLESMAWALLVVAEAVHRHGGSISYEQLRNTLLRRIRLKLTARPPSANTAKLFLRCGKAWLRSIGALTPEAQRPLKFAGELRAFTMYMRVEQGLSPATSAGPCTRSAVVCAASFVTPYLSDGADPISRRLLNCHVSTRLRMFLGRRVWRRLAGFLKTPPLVMTLSISVITQFCRC